MDPSYADTKTWLVTYPIECATAKLGDMEWRFVTSELRHNTHPMCPHLRVCDVIAFYSNDEDFQAAKRRGSRYDYSYCTEPLCYMQWHFHSTCSGFTVLAVQRGLGFVEDPVDPIWIASIQAGPKPQVHVGGEWHVNCWCVGDDGREQDEWSENADSEGGDDKDEDEDVV